MKVTPKSALPKNRIWLSLGIILILVGGALIDSSAQTLYSVATGPWNNANTWSNSPGGTPGFGVPGNGYDVIIDGNFIVSVTASTASLNSLTINSGSTLLVTGGSNVTAATTIISGSYNLAGTGILSFDDLDIENGGVLTRTNSGAITIGLGGMTVHDGGTYNHSVNGGTIPSATWFPTSNCNVTAVTNSNPTPLNQAFGNFLWNCPGQTITTNFSPSSIGGNLEVRNANTGQLRLNSTPRTVSGNLIMSGGSFAIASGASRILNVLGDVLITAGTLDISRTGGATGTLNVAGNYSHTGGTVTETSTGTAVVVFNKAGTQTFTSGGTVNNTISYTVNNGSTLQMAAPGTIVSGGGTFTLLAGSTLGVTSNLGITTAGANGNIQTTTRTYAANANYIYNGTADQVVGNGLTQNIPANVRIDNTGNTVSLSATTTIGGALLINAGTLDTNGQINNVTGLTTVIGSYLGSGAAQNLNGGLTISGGTFTGSTGDVITTNVLNNGTVTAPGHFNVSGNWTNNGTFNNSSGTVTFNGTTQTIGGSSSSTFYNLSTSGSTSTTTGVATVIDNNLSIGNGTTFTAAGFALTVVGTTQVGSGSSGNLTISSSLGTKTFGGLVTLGVGSTWNNSGNSPITFLGGVTRSSGTFTVGSGAYTFATNSQSLTGTFVIPSVTINGVALTNNNALTVGSTLNGSGSLTQAVNSSLTILGGSTITSINASNTGNTVTFNGPSQTINSDGGIYHHLTINQTGGTNATLGGTIQVNGTLTLTNGNLNIGSNNLLLGSAATIAGASSTTMILASGGGVVRKTYSGAGTFVFPVGDNSGTTEYSPISVNATAGSFPSDISVSVVDAKHPNNSSSTNFLSRYWNVTSSNTVTATLTGNFIATAADLNGLVGNISSAQLSGSFNQTTNPWIKFVPLASNILTATNASIVAGQTSSFTGITGANPTVSITGGGITICAGNSVPLNAPVTGGDPTIIYSWSPAAGLSSTTIANPSASPIVTTLYTVTIRDGNGIVATNNTTITVDQAPTVANAGPPQEKCNDDIFTLAGNSPGVGSGLWTIVGPANGTAITTPTSNISGVTGLDPGFSVTLRWTISNGVCTPPSTSDVLLTNKAAPTADAGAAAGETCKTNAFTVSDASFTNGTILWTENGAGALINASTLSPTYIAVAADAGTTVTLTMTVSSSSCTDAVDTKLLSVSDTPTADAGAPTGETCGVTPFVVSGATTNTAAGIVWTENGAGTITAGATTLTPTYTPAAGDAGTVVTLTMTVSNGSCANAVDTKALTVTAVPTANAGAPAETCENTAFIVSGASSSNGTILWTENGAGSLINATTLTPTYTPTAADAGNVVTLTLTIDGNGSCADAVATKALTISTAPTADAGAATGETCGVTPFTVSGATTNNLAGIVWTENGLGSITSGATTLTPTYTPAAGDAGAIVTLTMTVTTASGSCVNAVDTKALTVRALPTADAGAAAGETCKTNAFTVSDASFTNGTILWTENGGGTLINASTLSPTYIPVAADAGTTVTLTMTVSSSSCTDAVDTKLLSVSDTPTADAGAPTGETCGVTPFVVSGATTNTAAGIVWTENGAGTITAGATTLTPTYTPAAGDAGTVVTLTMTVTSGSCAAAVDTKALTVTAVPTANAGAPAETCENTAFIVSGASSSNGTILWTENGAGSLINATTLTPTYTPTAADAGNVVTLTLTIDGNGSCADAVATKALTISTAPTADAGAATGETCGVTPFTVSGATTNNLAGIVWTENGLGSITSGATTLTPTYTPAAGDAGTIVTLTMTVTTASGSCVNAVDTKALTVRALPTADAGAAAGETCKTNAFTVSDASFTNGTILWTENGAGALINASTLSPTYIPVAADAGTTVTLTMTVSSSSCTDAVDTKLLSVSDTPTADAGAPTGETCGVTPFVVSGATTNTAAGIVWTENGAGTITAGATTLTPTYTPAAGDAGTVVTLTMTVTSGSCAAAVDTKALTVTAVPTANAGAPAETCENTAFIVSGASSSNGTILWTENGAGSLINATTLTPTYTPTAADAGNVVTLTLTIDGNGSCADAVATKALTISTAPTADAGAATGETCGVTPFTVSGATTNNLAGIVWTENGLGSITSGATTLTPTYTPAAGDAGAIVTLTMTVTTASGSCVNAVDTKALTVRALPTADAGAAAGETCKTNAFTVSDASFTNGTILWTENGGGTLINASTLSPTYIPVAADAGTTVTLTMTVSSSSCTDAVDTKLLSVSDTPTADAGAPTGETCGVTPFVVSGATTNTAAGIVWTENGAGSITSGATTLTPTYTPAAGDAGTIVTLTMTVTSGSCANAVDTKALTVTAVPTANAGAPAETCENTAFIVSGASSSNGTILWTENGAGSLINATTLTPTYTPTAADAGNVVTLTLTIDGNGSCADAVATKALTISTAPTADAGAATGETCGVTPFTVSGATTNNLAGIVWTENGLGSITSGATTLTPTYTPAAGDAGAIVTLTMTVTTASGSCVNAVDTKALTVRALPTADAGAAAGETCKTNAFTVSDASFTNGTILWTENGAGALINASTLSPTYIPVAADAGTTVTLTMTVSSSSCTDAVDTKLLSVSDTPTADAGAPTGETCGVTPFVVSGATTNTAAGIVWTENGAGTITAGATTLTPTYTPAAGDAGTVVTLTMTVTSGSCAAAVDTKALTVTAVPTANAGAPAETCENTAFIVSGASSSNGTILWTENGAGSLINATTLTPTYTPTAADAGNVVTLTLTIDGNGSCADAVATKALTISTAPTADAGAATGETCGVTPFTVSGATTNNLAGIVWTENGLGSITSGATTLTPTYTPAAGDAGAIVTLTMTVTTASGSCLNAVDTKALTVRALPTADAGAAAGETCKTNAFTVSDASFTNGTILWTENGGGTLINASTLSPTYIAVAADAGTTVTLTMTVSSSSCTDAVDTKLLSVSDTPTADAGAPTGETCGVTPFVVSGATTNTAAGIVWTENGAGTITAGATTLTPTYTPAAGDAGTVVTLTMTVSNGSCANAVDTKALTVTAVPTANAGAPAETCENTAFIVSGASSSNGTILWTENGAGSLINATTLTPTYTPTAADAGNVVTLTLTIDGNGSCADAVATKALTISTAPTADAGAATGETCGVTPFTVSGATTNNLAGIVWTENGLGSITSGATTLTPTYTPAAGDAGAIVTLTMTVTTASGSCVNAVDTKALTVRALPTADAGAAAGETCKTNAFTVSDASFTNGTILWTENGGGTLINASTLSPTYIPVAADAGTTVTLTMTVSSSSCTDAVDTKLLSVSDTPTADAGAPTGETCGVTPFVVSGATTNTAAGIVWTENGAGTITAGATTLTPTYTPAAGDAGTVVTLTMTVTSGSCAAAVDTKALTVTAVPTANAGAPAETCENTAFIVSGASSSNGTILWTENGAGSLINATTLTPTYTPTAADAGNVVTLTLTIDGNGSCADAVATKALTISTAPTADAGAATGETCGVTPFTVSGATTNNLAGIVWTENGLGSITSGATTLTPTYTPAAGDAGTIVTLTMTVTTASGSCVNAVDTKALTVRALPTADAGAAVVETCGITPFTVSGASTNNTSGIVWTENGGGTLINATTLSPTYVPVAADAGTIVTLTMTVTSGSCADAIDTKALTVTTPPTADAGAPTGETCGVTPFTVSGATTNHVAGIVWTENGAGSITAGATTLTPTYTPAAGDAGTVVTLTMTVSNGSCANAVDTKALTVTAVPTANAGAPAETCENTAFIVSGASSSNGTILWTHDGDGTLTNATTLTPTYTPAATDAGSIVTLTLTIDGNGSCADAVATKALTITTAPTADAGAATAEVCVNTAFTVTDASSANGGILWSHDGDGTLTNATSIAPTYTPASTDAGSIVILTLTIDGNGTCANVSDQKSLQITPAPVVFAGSNAETCQGVSFTFTSQSTPSSASNYSSVLWTHSGNGTLFNGNTLTPTYQPGPTEAGNVTFTLTAYGNGTCLSVNDQMTLAITPVQTVSAGSDSETCEGVAFNFVSQITDATATNYSSLLWTAPVGATGILSNATSIAPTYAPGVGETGTRIFTLTAYGNGSCVAINDVMVLTITPSVIVDAGSDQEICQGGSFNFSNQSTLASASNFSSLAWTHNGAGTLFNGNTLTPTYFASSSETGIITFTLKAFPNGSCGSSTNTMSLTITPAPIVNAGSDDAVCQGTPTFNFGTRSTLATIANGTLIWTHTGAGSLDDNTALSPVYTVGAGDFGTTVIFTLSVTSGSSVCSLVTDQFELHVNKTALVSVPAPSIVCEPAQISLLGSVGGSATSGAWSLLTGGGSLSVSSVSVTGIINVSAVYDTIRADVGNTMQFRLTTNDPDGVGPCTTVSADMNVTINESAKVSAGSDFEVCEYESISLNGSYSGSTSSVVWSGGSGAPRFGNVTAPITTYAMTPAERAASGLSFTFTLTTNDPAGVCPSVSDQVVVTVNDTLNFVTFTGLDVVYQEDDLTETLAGVPPGGIFTGPGIVAGTSIFNPDNANIGTNFIIYTYTDPATGCLSAPRKSTIVNPVTTVEFRVLISVAPDVFATEDVNGFPQICSDIGDVRLRGLPDVNEPGHGTPTEFSSPQPILDTRITTKPDGFYYIITDGLPAGVYDIIYTYTNQFGATTFLQKKLTVYSSPKAIIDAANSCVSSVLNFTESSVITGSNPTAATLTDWAWDFGNGIGSTIQEPSYQYPSPGNYNIVLQVTTSEGCKHDTLKAIRVGPTPSMNFVWSAFCNGNDTKFVDKTNPGISTITQYAWEFSDGFTLTGPAGGPVPAGTNGGRTSGTYTNPNHKYDTFGQFDVKLTVSTNDGCVNDTTKRAFILSYGTPSPTAGYFESFESGPGTWVGTRADVSIPTDTSWVYGLPSGAVINSASSGSNAWWTGSNTNVITDKSTYYANEKSAVIGPCINLANLKRPMISIDYWSDSEDGRDGAVVQYSIDGGRNWQAIGDDAGSGLSWYDGRALTGNPGLQALGQFGWSTSNYTTGGWKTARYNLDQIPKANRSEVIFRVAFGSNNDNQFNDPSRSIEYSGFAFDNVFIGEKQRNVLVEYFTNAGINPSANDYLNNLLSNQLVIKDSSDFIKIQYHIENPSADVINQSNPVDPEARSGFYGILQPPVGIMDGLLGNYFGTVFNGDQTKITANEIDRRSLESPLFDAEVTELPTVTSDSINLNVDFRYIDPTTPFNSPVTLHIALVDSLVSGNVNVVRKMLSGGEGKTINIPWTFGTIYPVSIKSVIDVPIGIDNSNLWIVAFVQDRSTKRIHQSWMKKISMKTAATIVGVEDPVLDGANRIDIYPNPASRELNFTSEYRLVEGYTYSIVDQRGVTMLKGKLQEDIFNPQQVELNNLTDGVYFVIISRGGRALVHRKIAVIKQH